MKRTTKYVAFDVHQATTVASVRDDSGPALARSVLETSTRLIVHNRRDQRSLQWCLDVTAGGKPRRYSTHSPRVPGCVFSKKRR